MNTNMFALASGLSDHDLLDSIAALARKEREASAELVAHLAVLDARPSLYAALGHGSLFSYCTQALRLSEDAACNRIDAARACRRFPMILERLASGALSLATVRMLRPHPTPGEPRGCARRGLWPDPAGHPGADRAPGPATGRAVYRPEASGRYRACTFGADGD